MRERGKERESKNKMPNKITFRSDWFEEEKIFVTKQNKTKKKKTKKLTVKGNF